ncbi:hypothetical protein C8R44DRAFT_881605 [Mycena epipterygia]|nr:hypothetical protein C8R44DRAFT_881605 [Mycena epipterygia]
MSFLSLFTTFLKTTLLSIRTLLLRLFMRPPRRHTSYVTPYPQEHRIIDISSDRIDIQVDESIDVEKTVSGDSSRLSIAVQTVHNDKHIAVIANKPETEAANERYASTVPTSRIVHPPALDPFVKYSSTLKHRTPQPLPLSTVANFARTPRKHIASKSQGENNDPSRTQARKPTPLRRMPRYLNLTGTLPTNLPAYTQSSNGIKSRRASLVWFADGPMDHDSPCISESFCGDNSSPFVTPLKLESGLQGESLDWAARIRSVFYKRDEGEDDEHESARDLFNRDSVGFALDHAMDVIEHLPCDDDEYEYGRPLSIVSTCYSPSSDASTDAFFPACALVSPLSFSSSSELPYLRESNTGLSHSSISSASFNDLLVSVERKHPGTDWKDVVQFTVDDEKVEYMGARPYGGIVGQNWSDLFSFDEYAN